MSAVTGPLGSARNSSHVHVRSVPPFSIVNVHRSSGVCGVGPAESTGKARVTDWPGGTRAGSASVFRRRPRKPRETKLTSVSFFMSVSPCAADSCLGRDLAAALDQRAAVGIEERLSVIQDRAPAPDHAHLERVVHCPTLNARSLMHRHYASARSRNNSTWNVTATRPRTPADTNPH